MTLFALTAEDIARMRAERDPRPCKGCGKVLAMRPNQFYCSAPCRNQHSPAHKKSKPPVRLNTLSRAQIEALTPNVSHKCLWCSKHFSARAGQNFCSLKCRNTYSNAASALLLERLQIEHSAWLTERASLIREIASLRAQLASLSPPVE